ncbi:FAD/NAD(P)-binding protein [Streptomyces longwoodensis]|uniref:FAD/NAD(P)-binding protein n=1 Tax=Streptomyces longwoodensis TaxID=68231 RepID=UPI002254AB33|nr:FAD/NAD(P)-binding protein [Streptomyces longwoodensis]MCX4997773.1 FAD/NAD(P)-binding protein [Streptomyces longwoodensis]
MSGIRAQGASVPSQGVRAASGSAPAASTATPDMQTYVEQAARTGQLVVQPRMGMSDPRSMADGLAAVAAARARTLATLTIDSYTRVEDIAGAEAALAAGRALNGFPLVNHGPRLTAEVARAADGIPVQVRHGSARPAHIFDAMVAAGLSASEGGPVSYCLPYSRLPLAEAVPAWTDATQQLADRAVDQGLRAHLETFGGCMLGQMCPPSLLVAISVLEAMFFARNGITSVSLSYAQQTNAVQDVEALAALHHLAELFLPTHVARHVVLYTYMGVYPATEAGAELLLDSSAQLAVRGGAQRLIVKTVAEAHRIPTVAENVAALERAARVSREALRDDCPLPWARQADYETVYSEALRLITAVLDHGSDIGTGLRAAFADGTLDVPFCLHRDNAGAARGAIGDDGRLVWAATGAMPLPAPKGTHHVVTSSRLLSMLRFTADAHDRSAELLTRTRARVTAPHRVAVVGSGPRGLAVVERLVARLRDEAPDRAVEIVLIDKDEVGAGRVWRSDQNPVFLMNTACGEVTMFSGPADDGPARAGAGPTLAQWWAATEDPCYPGPNAYAPRALYGAYLGFFLQAVQDSLPAGATLRRHTGHVTAMQRNGAAWQLRCADGELIDADRVVLATGHPLTELSPDQARFADFAARDPRREYVRGDSAADMPLERIAPGSHVAVLGMGLTFYDVVAALTSGRGGRFREGQDGTLRYLPSGLEPVLVAGSRSGVPLPARGRNQKGPLWRYPARLFTPQRIAALRAPGRPLDFRAQVWPWLHAEMHLVHYGTEVRARLGDRAEQEFLARATALVEAGAAEAADEVVRTAAARLGVDGLPPLDVDALARPFAGRGFAGPAAFHAALREVIDDDLRHAGLGNHDGPRKAALDVLRDVRGTIRRAVDFDGLTAASHRDDFLGWFAPLSSFLAAGPPAQRLRQTRALLDAGVLRVVGPSAEFAADEEGGHFTVRSRQVDGSLHHCEALVDARIPAPDLDRDTAPLTRHLRATGLWTPWTNHRGDGGPLTGGVATTTVPYRPVTAAGTPADGVYVLGIPSEGQRWFMQVGSARPGPWTDFTGDADAIARDALAALPRPATARTLEGARA